MTETDAATASRTAPDDVTVMVAAAGSLVGWRAATFVPVRAASPTAWRCWYGPAGSERNDVAPPWVWGIDAQVWRHQRVVWRPGSARTNDQVCGAVVVPVRGDSESEIEGVLAFHGPDVREPERSAVAVLEGVATLVARRLDRRSGTPTTSSASGTSLERAIALVDVFAYTVQVTPEGSLEWRYFGPNSATVFGSTVTPDESLAALVRRHADPADREAVDEFVTATSTGRPFETEIRLIGGDGVTRWISWRVVPRFTDAEVQIDGVATDVSSRHTLGRSRRDLVLANEQYVREVDLRRRHALAMLEANDNVLQRLFAAGLRLQVLKRRLGDVEAHAASAIAFQLDQAATDLRALIVNLNDVIETLPDAEVEDLAAS
jgi:hypothetical protein